MQPVKHTRNPPDVVKSELVLRIDGTKIIGRRKPEYTLSPTDFLTGGECESKRAKNIKPSSRYASPHGRDHTQQQGGQEKEECGEVLEQTVLPGQNFVSIYVKNDKDTQQDQIEPQKDGTIDGYRAVEQDSTTAISGRGGGGITDFS